MFQGMIKNRDPHVLGDALARLSAGEHELSPSEDLEQLVQAVEGEALMLKPTLDLYGATPFDPEADAMPVGWALQVFTDTRVQDHPTPPGDGEEASLDALCDALEEHPTPPRRSDPFGITARIARRRQQAVTPAA